MVEKKEEEEKLYANTALLKDGKTTTPKVPQNGPLDLEGKNSKAAPILGL